MMTPDLPVGSPERTALFAMLRHRFRDDWREAEKATRKDRDAGKDDLYFVRAIGFDAVKIGRGNDPRIRLRELQIGCPFELELWAVLPGRGREEKQWHQHFNGHKIRGEWFARVPELEAAIQSGSYSQESQEV